MALPDSGISGEEIPFPEIIELNVGGQVYITRYSTLTSVPDSLLWEMFSQKSTKGLARDTKGRFFVDRDGFLFRYILDYMRDQQLVLPDHFPERGRLQREAEFFNLPELVKLLAPKISKQNSLGDEGCPSDPEDSSPGIDSARSLGSLGAAAAACASLVPGAMDGKRSGFITIGYRGSYTLGRDSHTDAKFRRVARIMVCGKTSLAKEVFGETLNESRDPDRPPERYTSRYYLKFTFLEQAFDKLADAGFHMVACNSTGTCAFAHEQTDDKIWTSYTEYVFYRSSSAIPEAVASDPPAPDEAVRPKPAALLHESTIMELGSTGRTKSLPETSCSSSLDLHKPLPPPLTPPPPPLPPAADIPDLPLPSPPILPPPLLSIKSASTSSPPPSLLSIKSASTSSPPVPPVPPLGDSPQRPTTLNIKTLPRSTARENGGPPPRADDNEDERKLLEEDLKKCIEDFKKIRLPTVFPDRKRHWQNDLLKKYNA
ncbi:BTB/POZ domain-containing protein KCTD12b [Poeciliopsis prolifica]|uniref:BTB/POZ domain-containing protein KCTD12b n=1 Tax=Poeciliopsis prolifica TaxID=188132 RepID=UPI0024136CDA|nr:BTB/POZ domain-containing protein KCTD12b [Poeciliopsis prolifica]